MSGQTPIQKFHEEISDAEIMVILQEAKALSDQRAFEADLALKDRLNNEISAAQAIVADLLP